MRLFVKGFGTLTGTSNSINVGIEESEGVCKQSMQYIMAIGSLERLFRARS